MMNQASTSMKASAPTSVHYGVNMKFLAKKGYNFVSHYKCFLRVKNDVDQ